MKNVQRFIDAQEKHYKQALLELRQGRKKTHWIWFIFPQHRKLGHSFYAKYYGLASLTEARDYLAVDLLKQRYMECLTALVKVENLQMEPLDLMKLQSSLTLFCLAANEESQVQELCDLLLEIYFDGELCHRTEAILLGLI